MSLSFPPEPSDDDPSGDPPVQDDRTVLHLVMPGTRQATTGERPEASDGALAAYLFEHRN